jgi:hypothetical protein
MERFFDLDKLSNEEKPKLTFTVKKLPKPPRKLYKYQRIDEKGLNINNIKNNLIWFSKPYRFDDPFDCQIKIEDFKNVTDEDIFKALNDYLREKKQLISISEYSILETQLLNAPISKHREIIKTGAKTIFDYCRDEILNKKGVACFSEKYDDLLMWSLYSDKHTGFCIEFDTLFEPFIRAIKVEYAKNIPTISFLDTVESGVRINLTESSSSADFMLPMITTKAKCWEYQKEWRIFNESGDIGQKLDCKCLTKIFFGLRMPVENQKDIMLILQNKPIEFFRMKMSEKEFKLIPEKIK